ncbi:hypothetical protein [Glutamicibacter halophytocola]|uniref:hypothetical protein n=1 Tax=Glutamicibacter halophytocola TaxID=1933880 RepID=UPI00370451BD
MASDERVVRFIGFGQPWNQQDIDSCVEAALQNQDLNQVGTSRWFVATMAKQPVGLIFSTRQESSIEIGYWVSRRTGDTALAGKCSIAPWPWFLDSSAPQP